MRDRGLLETRVFAGKLSEQELRPLPGLRFLRMQRVEHAHCVLDQCGARPVASVDHVGGGNDGDRQQLLLASLPKSQGDVQFLSEHGR